MATGQFNQQRIMYSSSVNLVGLTASNIYGFNKFGQLGPPLGGSLTGTTWATLLAGYQPSNGIWLMPDNATGLTLQWTSPALTGATAPQFLIVYLNDPPPSSTSGSGFGTEGVPLSTDVINGCYVSAPIATATAGILSIPVRTSPYTVLLTASTPSGVPTTPDVVPPYRYFMITIFATAWPTSAGLMGPLQVNVY